MRVRVRVVRVRVRVRVSIYLSARVVVLLSVGSKRIFHSSSQTRRPSFVSVCLSAHQTANGLEFVSCLSRVCVVFVSRVCLVLPSGIVLVIKSWCFVFCWLCLLP
jgi:hypothetical protein